MLEEIESLVSLENIEKHKRYRLNKGKLVFIFLFQLYGELVRIKGEIFCTGRDLELIYIVQCTSD